MASDPAQEKPTFEQLAEASPPSLVVEFFEFLKHNKKWWLLPILVMIALFGVLMALASTGVAPFIYTLF